MKRNKHNLSHYHLFTGEMGKLIPAAWTEVLPGDTFDGQTQLLVRCSPLVAPVMHPVQVRIHHWFVPLRLIWDEFTSWIVDPNPQGTVPSVTPTGNLLLDYLGIPPAVTSNSVSALPIRAYNKIFNEFYRDQQLRAGVPQDNQGVRTVSWEKDFLTSARPNPQLGDNTFHAPVYGTGETGQGQEVGEVYVDELRKAFALQRFAEARNRYGSRYTEYLQYLGIRPSDASLQRPQFLGGGRQTISFSEVLQTAEGTTTVVGEMRGHGIAAVQSNRYRKFFEEHGILMTLVSVRPKSIYMNNIAKKWKRFARDDWWQKETEQIGAEAVETQEVFADGTVADSETFGWQDRFYSYRQELSRVSSGFRTSELDFWHLGRDFEASPTLNSNFVKCIPSKRVFADQGTANNLYFMASNQIRARRLVGKARPPRVL